MGEEIHNFDSKVRISTNVFCDILVGKIFILKLVTALEQEVKTAKEKLEAVLKKTFRILDIINEEEILYASMAGIGVEPPMPCPFVINRPYLVLREH